MMANAVEEESLEVETGAVWWIGEVSMEFEKVLASVATRNSFSPLVEIGCEDIDIGAVAAEKLTRESAMKYNEADVRKPLACAVNVAKAGNRIVLDEDGGYIENKKTNERMKVRVERNTYVFDVQLDDDDMVAVTLIRELGAACGPRD